MKKINICGTDFKIVRTKDLHTDQGALDGQVRYDDSTIAINTKIVDKGRLAEVFMHEIVHAIDASLHISLSEENVQRMASGLHSMGVSHFLVEKADG